MLRAFHCILSLIVCSQHFSNLKTTEEESVPNKTGRRGSQVSLPSPVPEDTEAAGSSDSKETSDTRMSVNLFRSNIFTLLLLLLTDGRNCV